MKYALWGFLFGALGLYVLAALSLISPLFETVFMPLFWPGRHVASMFVGNDGSTTEVLLLILFNGLFYAGLFLVVSIVLRKKRLL